MKRTLFLLFAGALLLAVAVVVVTKKEPSGRSVNEGATPAAIDVSFRMPIPAVDAAFAPYYLAIDRGQFAKSGLNVTIQPGSPELSPVKMLSQGVDQFAILGGPELLFSARAKGAPLVAIAQIHKDSDFVIIITKPESDITEVRQLRGRQVGFFYGHISTDILRILFRQEDIQVDEVDVGFDYGQFINNKIPAQWAFRTTAALQLPSRGVPVNIISPADYGIRTQGHMLVTTEDMIVQKPAQVQAFLDCVLEAIEYAMDHEDDAIAAALQRDPNFTADVGKMQLAIYTPAIRRNSKIGWIDHGDMSTTKEQMLVVGLIPNEFNVDSAYNLSFLEKHYAAHP